MKNLKNNKFNGSAFKLKKKELRELEIQQLEKEHHEQVAAATFEKIDLMTKPSAGGSDTGKLNELFTGKTCLRTKNWFKIGSIHHRLGKLQIFQMNWVCIFLVPSLNQTKPLLFVLLQLKF